MREIIRYGFILAVICIISAGLLAGVNSLTKGRILEQARAEEEASLKEIFPEGFNFEAVTANNQTFYYKASDKSGKFIGVAFKASAKGYSSTIETMAGMLGDGTITVIKVLSQNETPGLGSRVAESDFTARFKNKRDLREVQAITGATISSKAVIDSVKSKAEEIKKLMTNGKIQSTKLF